MNKNEIEKKETRVLSMPIYKSIPVNELVIAEKDGKTYQRRSSKRRIEEIANDFDFDIFGIILVNKRDDNYYIIDGQHRVEALRKLGVGSVICQVLTGLTYEEEAEKFCRLNTRRTPLDSVGKFVSAVESGEEIALVIRDILNKNGFYYPKQSTDKNANVINCVSTLQNIIEESSEETLDKTLYIIRNAWGYNKDAVRASLIAGLAGFYNNNSDINDKTLIKALSKINAQDILLEMKRNSKSIIGDLRSNKSRVMVADIIKEIYNAEAKKQKRKNIKSQSNK